MKKSSKFLEKDVVPLKKETIRKNQISLRLKSKEDEEEININTLQFKDLLSKLENLKVGLLIDETVKILLENSLL